MADISKIKLPDGNTYDIKDSAGRKEANLEWGGKNFAASFGPIDAAMIPELGANRFAFLKAAGITVEYSTDGGSTWVDYGLNDYGKTAIFGKGNSLYLGKHTTAGSSTLNDQLRIVISTSPAGIYSTLNKIAIYMSTQGNTVQVKLDMAIESTPTNFVTKLDWTGIAGWSGWNILNVPGFTTYSNYPSSQYGRIRFTFRQTAVNTGSYAAGVISRIMAFGGVGWTTPSRMAADGHLYDYDSAQNATFPAKVTATGGFSGNLTGNASTATDATNLMAYSGNEVTIGANSTTAGASTNDSVWFNFRDRNGGSASNNSTKITNYYFGNRKGSVNGVVVNAGTFKGSVTGDVTGNVSGTASNVTGTVAIANGGTGQTTATNAANVFIDSLTAGTSVPVDGDTYVSSYADGKNAAHNGTNTYHRRPISQLWEYIKGKISSVLGLTSTNYGGTAAKATADASGNTITSYYAPKSTAVTNVALATNKITKTINGTTTDVVTAATTSAYGITKLSTSTSSTATDVAATPSAVKTAYDLANSANTTANTALSGVNGNLIYDHTFTISNGVATFTPHVYQKGTEVTTNYAASCFTWKYRLINGTEVNLTTKSNRGCDVTITNLGYGGHVIGTFTPS